jgi:hypothetical protein
MEVNSMKTLVAVAVAVALATSAHVASAYVAVVGTIPIPSAPDAERSAHLEAAIWAAIRDVLEHAVAFTPTVVTIEDARVVGDRLRLLIFLSDESGESVPQPPTRHEGPGDRRDHEAGSGPPAEMPQQRTWL